MLGLGCSPLPIWEVSVLNMTESGVVLKNEKSRSTEIAPRRAYNKWHVRPGETLKVFRADELLEEHQPSELGFKEGEDGRVLLVVGGPSDVVVADYSDFYTEEGEQAKAEPVIRLVADLRRQSSVVIERGDLIAWPHQGVAETRYHGGGFKNRRFLRVVGVGSQIADDKLMDYLAYELKRQVDETANAE